MALALFGGDAARAQTAAERQWFTLTLEGQRSGYAYRERVASPDGSIERDVLVLELAQGRQRSEVTQTIEIERDVQDRPQRVRLHAIAGTARAQWEGSVDNGMLRIRAQESAGSQQVDVLLPPDAIFPGQQVQKLRALTSASTAASVDYRLFDPVLAETVAVSARRIDDADAHAAGQTHIRATRRVHDAERYEDYWLGADGRVQRIQAQFIGLTLAWLRCEHDCDRVVEPPFDPMARMVVRSPYRIPSHVWQGRIRYVIARSDGQRPKLVATDEQSVVYDGARAIVTVCVDCNAHRTPAAAELARYRAANAWVQSDAAEIRELAERAGSRSLPVAVRMQKLSGLVRARMRGPLDYLGYADALQALHSGSGDCTEYAVLLTALARAQDIPARVVFGLAYADRFTGRKDVFSPHAWVQAWDGRRWVSYDPALGSFDATHLAIAIGTGDPNEVDVDFRQLQKLKIEKIGLIRTR